MFTALLMEIGVSYKPAASQGLSREDASKMLLSLEMETTSFWAHPKCRKAEPRSTNLAITNGRKLAQRSLEQKTMTDMDTRLIYPMMAASSQWAHLDLTQPTPAMQAPLMYTN